MRKRPALLPACLVLLLLALPACGIGFSDSFDGTETFKTIELAGERTVGSELTLRLTVTQGYPTPVRIICSYEDDDKLTDDQKNTSFSERSARVTEVVLPPAEGVIPAEEDLPREELVFTFTVSEEGDYFLACYTPAAQDNGIGLAFKIRAGSPS